TAICHRRADQYFALTAIAREQDTEGSKQGRKERHPFASADCLEGCVHRGRQDKAIYSPAKRLPRRSRMICGQIQSSRGVPELIAPIGKLLLYPLLLQPLTLPEGIIRILQRRRRQTPPPILLTAALIVCIQDRQFP